VKCPKCDYLGFETGDTCKNCGYDFSLIGDPDSDPIEIDLDLRSVDSDLAIVPDWPDAADISLSEFAPQPELEPPAPEPVVATREPEPPLPLFTPTFGDDDDEPLIKLPAAPRPPLAVRRTPDTPRLRVVPKPLSTPLSKPLSKTLRAAEAAPALAFDEDEDESQAEPDPPVSVEPPRQVSRVWADPQQKAGVISLPGTRLAAAAIDHLLLGGVDVVVMYLTTRIAGLTMGEWTALPPTPMLSFLLMLKLSYFAAFTAVGGQTIGKMALRLRVVAADRTPVDGPMAVKRTLAGAVSALTLGLGYVPAFFDTERRTLHDRLACTRVVALPPS
jgi:uncharacterized RDD family membrane protein YckC